MMIGRRVFLRQASKAIAGSTLILPALEAFAKSQGPSEKAVGQKLKVMVTGGHPGDPECGCGGTIVRYSDAGHDVVLMYLNRGQAYCSDTTVKDCGAIRTAEAEKACAILKARAAFAGQYDGKAVVDPARYDEFLKLFETENPQVVLAQWPIDKHRDHRALSNLVLDAWMESGKRAAFYYYGIAEDTMMFTPMEFVDISAVEPKKRAACFAHASQQPEKWYPLETELTKFWGTESGFAHAEGFLKHWESKGGVLPGGSNL
jgi:N-acetylglucosamine malate deacetylase 1